MVKINIDGKEITSELGKSVIEAAMENGIDIPHFCWHPELSVSGNCRMCLVEIGLPKLGPDRKPIIAADGTPEVSFMPKLQIACATQISDGMHVRTKTQPVLQAREAVMEFFLINHPLDCPICDEAGQCKLQDYAFNHSNGTSRFEENKNPKDKRVEWGPRVLYDGERCISCSRCIRYAKETAGQDVLSFVNRGDKVTIKVADGQKWDNPYSMNVIDICPVGALTSRDFRFKARVWEMSFNDSICNGCSRGCNIRIGVRNNEILRIDPKNNPKVNKTNICDFGRLELYPKAMQDRILDPLLRTSGELKTTDFQTAIAAVANGLKHFSPKEIMIVSSASATVETNFALSRLAKNVLKTSNIEFVRYIDKGFADDLLRREEMMPNANGAEATGAGQGIPIEKLISKLKDDNFKAVIVVEDDFRGNGEMFEVLGKTPLVVAIVSNYSKLTDIAHIVLPAAVTAESEGTFVNFKNRVQHFAPALITNENRANMGLKMSRLDKFGAPNDRWTQNTANHAMQSWRIISQIASALGDKWNYNSSKDVFADVVKSIPSFAGLDYRILDKHFGIVLGSSEPNAIPFVYDSHRMKPY